MPQTKLRLRLARCMSCDRILVDNLLEIKL